MEKLGFAIRIALAMALVATSAVGALAQTTVIIVRHAEKAAEPAEDPPLTVVLVVGHSNTVPAIIEALGAVPPPPICDAEYDNLYVVTISQNKPATLVRARFGVRTPVDSACAATMR